MTDGEDMLAYDRVAGGYAIARPSYPDEVFSTIDRYADLPERANVLEVGVGAGQATLQMAQRGWSVDAIDPGARLIEAARERCKGLGVRLHVARFEDVILPAESFDLVAAATSWHWVDPAVGYRLAHDALRPDGTVALFWNAHVPDTSHPAWQPIRRVYSEVAPELADLAPLTPDRADYDPVMELSTSGWFDRTEQHRFAFELSYSADEFLTLIDTYASHRSLTSIHRARLHDRLRSVIEDDLAGTVVKPYEALLVLGRRRTNADVDGARDPWSG